MSAVEKLEQALEQAKSAGLCYVYDCDPGIGRRKHGKGFVYYNAGGKPVTDESCIARCHKLAVPPAWKEVWICAQDNGHIQATGLDARGRKQYRYHVDWRSARDDNKFHNMVAFGHALPGIRRRVLAELNRDGLPKDKVIAAIVRLLDRTGLRVGNDAYMNENHTFGMTTIGKKHVDLHGKEIEFDFPGKGGKVWKGRVLAPKVAKVIAACEELPGYRLFKYLDDHGEAHSIGSADVNGWLQEISGIAITAKDFRTWTACSLFLDEALAQTGCEKPLHLKPVLKAVSSQLGNTPAILQKSYVHPDLIDLYRTGCFINREWSDKDLALPQGLRKTEGLLLRWLEKRYG
jgi:DNA topoisomerase-1